MVQLQWRREAVREAGAVSERTSDFGSFYAAEYSVVLAAVHGFTNDHHVAHEATQEAFARALARWDRIGREEWARGWVIRTAVNHCRRLARRRQREPRPTPDDAVSSDTESRIDLVAALRRLPVRRRTAVVLFYVGDLAVAQVAELMNLSESAVRTHLTLARRELKQELGGSDG